MLTRIFKVVNLLFGHSVSPTFLSQNVAAFP